jgi:hypothetical protein
MVRSLLNYIFRDNQRPVRPNFKDTPFVLPERDYVTDFDFIHFQQGEIPPR